MTVGKIYHTNMSVAGDGGYVEVCMLCELCTSITHHTSYTH